MGEAPDQSQKEIRDFGKAVLAMKKYIGRSIHRKEDRELLEGKACFVDDLKFSRMLEAAFVRSSCARARILHTRLDHAQTAPGVHSAFKFSDLPPNCRSLPSAVRTSELKIVTDPVLAGDECRYVGEPIAVILAQSRYMAEDAADLVQIEFEPLPPCIDLRKALLSDAAVVHQQLGSNLAGEKIWEVGDVVSAFARSDFVLQETFAVHRGTSSPLESRGLVAVPKTCSGGLFELEVWASTQSPYRLRDSLAVMLGIPPAKISVKACSVGGGFGPKSGFYSEDFIVSWLALKTGVPVKWVEDRHEHLLCARQERDQEHYIEAAFTTEGRILALKDEFIHDVGAYSGTIVSPWTTAYTIPGPYKVENLRIHMKLAFTNKVPTMTVRGAGRPEAVFIMERVMDRIADNLNMDRAEIRRRNLLTEKDLPWDTGLTNREGEPVVYEKGDLPDALEPVLRTLNYERLRSNLESGNHTNANKRGVGFACYLISTGRGPFELARVLLDANGRVTVYAGTSPQGQGHNTSLAQICAEELGIGPDCVTVKTGDTTRIPEGFGTFASRSAVTAGNAVALAARSVREQLAKIGSAVLDLPDDALQWENWSFCLLRDAKKLAVADLLEIINRTATKEQGGGFFPIEGRGRFDVAGHTFAAGAHGVVVEVDPRTGQLRLLRYVVAHDCGLAINPTIVEGQLRGGVTHGIGNSVLEKMSYDENGQVLSATLKDYLLPLVVDVCPMEFLVLQSPSEKNPLGIKGVGESGAVASPAAIISAVEDALKSVGVKIDFFPISPDDLVRLISAKSKGQ